MEKYNKVIGNNGEKEARKFLTKNGYKILHTNYTISGGEIDIIAQKGDYVIFVEVKTRSDLMFGSGAQAVTYIKQKKIIKTAQCFLQSFGESYARFDVIEVIGSMDGDKFKLEKISHIENAF